MHAKLLKARFGLLYSLIATVVLPSAPVSAGDEAFIVLPGEPTRYSGQQGREGDFTELLATADKTGGSSAIFVKPSHPRAVPLHTCTKWKLSFVTL
ncbi:hypothetical protein [Bradyrhizobium sp. 6(2017)]|uniref:hypothetical protein n=1 Tax=Bradyrhizobium sp. 6(2017) TaxID=1197460 RepID=UPI002FE693E2